MSVEENKAFVHHFIQLANEKRFDELREGFDASYVYHSPNSPDLVGPNAITEMIAGLYAAFPDLKLELEDLMVEESKVAFRWVARGTHRGELMGVPPTGKRVTFRGMVMARVIDGKDYEAWEIIDQLSLLQQLGAIPGSEQAAA